MAMTAGGKATQGGQFRSRILFPLTLLILTALACGLPQNPLRPEPTSMPDPTPTSAPPTPDVPPFTLPSATMTTNGELYVSPYRAESIATIPTGQKVYILGRNATGSHLRIVWNTRIGWVPVSFTNYIGQRASMSLLPVFTREPPACAEPITVIIGAHGEWISDRYQKIAIVVDLFRARYGPFPRSSLTLKMNGAPVDYSRREIVEQGQFLLKDVVFALPHDAQPGDTIAFILDTSSEESLTFMATYFGIPGNCRWDID